MRWYKRIDPNSEEGRKDLKKLWPGYTIVHAQLANPDPQHELRAEQCTNSLNRFPVLPWQYSDQTLDDLITPQRIAGRWMPSIAQRATADGVPTLQYACPLRFRVHDTL
jgi:hypothetical protein